MAVFQESTFMCRSSKPLRLYRTPYDAKDSTTILPPNKIFTSNKQYIGEHTKMYHITSSDISSMPIGYWCSEIGLDIIPVIVQEPEEVPEIQSDGAMTKSQDLIINAYGAVVYKNSTGDSTIPNGLNLGDQILSDKQLTVMVNGVSETRYHISSLTGEDQGLVGGWIAGNRAIKFPDPVIASDNDIMLLTAVPAPPGEGGIGASTDNGATEPSNTSTNPTSSVVTGTDGEQTTVGLPNSTDTQTSTDDETVAVSFNDYSDENVMRTLYEAYGMDYENTTATKGLMGNPIGRMLFVHGMPFQFTHLTDRRGNSKSNRGAAEGEFVPGTKANSGSADMYGRTFAKEIAGNMPIAVIVPGKPKFLTNVRSGLFRGSSRDAAAGMLPAFAASDTALGEALATITESMEGDYQYYSLEVAIDDYFQYVNTMAHNSARFMGIGGMTYMGDKLESLDWYKYNSDACQDYGMFSEIVGLSGGVSFAFDPQGSVSDSISSSTGESKFASFFNNINSQAREIEFIMGYSGADAYKLIDSANFVGTAQSAMQGGLFGGIESVIDRVGTWLQNSLHGMNMRFPEIWNESSHSRSYDIRMHFISPYGTSFCKWRYVLVPFFHVFCLAAPKSDSNVSQYSSPFIIRAYSKGYFNVEMGIIENLTWERFGDGDMISEDGVPTQIDVTIQFKDLYHTLAMTNMYKTGVEGTSGTNNVQNFMNNTGLVDLIGTLSGVNMNRIALKDRLSMWASSTLDAWGSLGGNFMHHIQTRVRSVIENIFY